MLGRVRGGRPGLGASLGGAGGRPVRVLTDKTVVGFCRVRLCRRLCQRGRQSSPIGLRAEGLCLDRRGYEV